jgi:hypothetical protein
MKQLNISGAVPPIRMQGGKRKTTAARITMGRRPSTSEIDEVNRWPRSVERGASTLKPRTAYAPIASSTSA